MPFSSRNFISEINCVKIGLKPFSTSWNHFVFVYLLSMKESELRETARKPSFKRYYPLCGCGRGVVGSELTCHTARLDSNPAEGKCLVFLAIVNQRVLSLCSKISLLSQTRVREPIQCTHHTEAKDTHTMQTQYRLLLTACMIWERSAAYLDRALSVLQLRL